MIRLIRKSNSLMLLISNAYAFESVKLLLCLFSKTLSLLILIKMRKKLEKTQPGHPTSSTPRAARVPA